jgi:maltose O-acetyltransferase
MAPQPSPGIINTAQQALQIPPQQMPPQQMPSHQMASQQMPGQRMAPMGFGHPPAYPEKRNIERQKMVSGELYIHSTPELERDREKCAGLLSTFNGNNHSRADRSHRFDEIIAPEHAKEYNLPSLRAFRNNSKNTIDVPFRCEYGYNIRLGNYVTIEGGCHISDPREVFIDNNSYIGPGVKIIGKVLPADSNIRGDGLEIKARGFKINIGKSVYIGANSVIQPDPSEFEGDTLTIGDGAYIKPGSVVSKVSLSPPLFLKLFMLTIS